MSTANLNRIIWNAKDLRVMGNNPSFSNGHEKRISEVDAMRTWGEYVACHGMSAAQDTLRILDYLDELRNLPSLSQRVSLGNPNTFMTSIDLSLDKLSANQLTDVGSQVKLFFGPDSKGISQKDKVAWPAHILDVNQMTHFGSLLLEVTRPKDAEKNFLDDRVVLSGKKYGWNLPEVPVYLRLSESLITVKARLQGLNFVSSEILAATPKPEKKAKNPYAGYRGPSDAAESDDEDPEETSEHDSSGQDGDALSGDGESYYEDLDHASNSDHSSHDGEESSHEHVDENSNSDDASHGGEAPSEVKHIQDEEMNDMRLSILDMFSTEIITEFPVKAQFGHETDAEASLAFQEGQVLTVTAVLNDFVFYGSCSDDNGTKRVGTIPRNLVQPCELGDDFKKVQDSLGPFQDLDPADGHDDLDLRKQRSILMGKNVVNPVLRNFLEGLCEEEIETALREMTERQRTKIKGFLTRVPKGLLLIQGAAGCGKTTLMIFIIRIFLLRSKRLLLLGPKNAATMNLAVRTRNAIGDNTHKSSSEDGRITLS